MKFLIIRLLIKLLNLLADDSCWGFPEFQEENEILKITKKLPEESKDKIYFRFVFHFYGMYNKEIKKIKKEIEKEKEKKLKKDCVIFEEKRIITYKNGKIVKEEK